MSETQVGQPPRLNAAFGGIATFLRAAHRPDFAAGEADIAVLGVPFDEGSPYMGGSRFAPRAIREHSLRFGAGRIYDIERDRSFLVEEIAQRRIVDVGDVDIVVTNPEQTFINTTETVKSLLARGVLPVVLGGDHAISSPVVRAFDQPIHVVHFDAHLDYSPITELQRHTNGQPFRYIHAMDHVQNLTQIGIRSLRTDRDAVMAAKTNGSRIITMSEFRALTAEELAASLPADAPCYVSIDVDALDMTLVPGCVSAEPDGLSYRELRDTLAAVAARMDVVGFDFVEVNPLLDIGTGITAYLGAHTVVEFLGHICDQPRWRARRGK